MEQNFEFFEFLFIVSIQRANIKQTQLSTMKSLFILWKQLRTISSCLLQFLTSVYFVRLKLFRIYFLEKKHKDVANSRS